jgi:hypothetical protein
LTLISKLKKLVVYKLPGHQPTHKEIFLYKNIGFFLG